MREIVNLHFPDIDKGLLDSALGIFYELRQRGYEKPPATSELLNWLGALNHARVTPDRLNVPLREPKPLRVLVRDENIPVAIRAPQQNHSVFGILQGWYANAVVIDPSKEAHDHGCGSTFWGTLRTRARAAQACPCRAHG